MKRVLALVLIAASSLILTGCPTFTIGGWMPSQSQLGKANFGGTFFCKEVGFNAELTGQFNYTDHDFPIIWKGKERSLNFHGTLHHVIVGSEESPETCEANDEAFMSLWDEGTCGAAELKPVPRQEGDTGYDWEPLVINEDTSVSAAAFRIGLIDLETREISVSFGPTVVSTFNLNTGTSVPCPDVPGFADAFYSNSGMIGGGNINVRHSLLPE